MQDRASGAADSVRDLAERLAARDGLASVDVDDERRLALAWALKALCYEAWNTEPQRAVRAARALGALCGRDADAPGMREIDALARWTAGIAHLTRGEMVDAIGCFDAAAERFASLGKPHEAAQTQVPKIVALTMLGRHDEAVASAHRAHRDFVAHGDEQAAAKVSLNLGSLHLRRDEYADAALRYREAGALFARVGDHQHSIMADVGIADALTGSGEFDEALRIYARAGMRAGTHGFPVLQAIREESVALLELARGRYREALDGFERSRSRYEALAMPQHLAIAEKQLADAYLELRLLPEALALYDQAIAKFELQAMPDDLAWTLAQRGRAQALLGQRERAEASLSDAARLFVEQKNPVGESAVTLARAELALASADAGSARVLASKAAQGFLDAGLPERETRAEAVRADALLRSGALAEGRARFARALARARELGMVAVQVRCMTGEGLAALAMADADAARRAFTAAIGLFEQMRNALPGDDIRSAFLTDHLVPYRELTRLALLDHERAPSSGTASDVVVHLDRFRARALAERLARAVESEDDAPTRKLRARMNWLQRRVQRAYDEGGEWSTAAGELRRCESELLERERRHRLVTRIPDGTAADELLDVQALQQSLGDADAIVEYGVVDDELLACVITRGEIVVLRAMARWSDAREALRSARFQIETLRHGGAHVAHRLDVLTERARIRLAQLHDLVWAPLAPSLAACVRVLVVAHGELGALPFAALHDGSAYLAERIEICMAPSARLALRGLVRRPVAAVHALSIGVADRVRHAVDEAALVAGLFPGARALLNEEASIEKFRAASGDADVIHIACHAQFRSDNPMFSALQLNDGTLTVEMAERLRLRAGIVVLSACETGLAEQSAGDEMVGLVRAFFVAGAARVVASLWAVDDAITVDAMTSFYRRLREGLTPAAALRAAQCEAMRRHPHPFHWGAFTLYGGW